MSKIGQLVCPDTIGHGDFVRSLWSEGIYIVCTQWLEENRIYALLALGTEDVQICWQSPAELFEPGRWVYAERPDVKV